MDARFPYSPAEVAKVQCVQFGILSPDEIVIPPPPPPASVNWFLFSLCGVGTLEGLTGLGIGRDSGSIDDLSCCCAGLLSYNLSCLGSKLAEDK
jgi:hypothetical protein